MKKKNYVGFMAIAFMLIMLLSACNPVFPDYELDNFWKLDKIEYAGGDEYHPKAVYFGFARHIVQVRNMYDQEFPTSDYGFSKYGKIRFTNDSLHIDFSIYNNNTPQSEMLLRQLNLCGIESFINSYAVDKLNSKEMIIHNDNVVLEFKMW